MIVAVDDSVSADVFAGVFGVGEYLSQPPRKPSQAELLHGALVPCFACTGLTSVKLRLSFCDQDISPVEMQLQSLPSTGQPERPPALDAFWRAHPEIAQIERLNADGETLAVYRP
ncbi:MAG: hypothetical protein GC129_01215 [Proteobacteria bacterium]|nr:hypothetical protein [Pseudomonadota bacterium]